MATYCDQLAQCTTFDQFLALNLAFVRGKVPGEHVNNYSYDMLDLNPRLQELLILLNKTGLLTDCSQPGVYADHYKPLDEWWFTDFTRRKKAPLPGARDQLEVKERGRIYV